ncbi:MAG: HIT domain-containing protein [Bacilli bacterium]|nr:HIT domain-containing protein [Bacilli bacterium]
MDCIFCKIINKEVPSHLVYEDEILKIFLDINPATNGECLIVPKNHFKTIMELDNETNEHILKIEKKLYLIFKEKLGCDGMTIMQNNDYGQEVPHFHIHLVPRYNKDMFRTTSDKDLLVDFENIINQLND